MSRACRQGRWTQLDSGGDDVNRRLVEKIAVFCALVALVRHGAAGQRNAEFQRRGGRHAVRRLLFPPSNHGHLRALGDHDPERLFPRRICQTDDGRRLWIAADPDRLARAAAKWSDALSRWPVSQPESGRRFNQLSYPLKLTIHDHRQDYASFGE